MWITHYQTVFSTRSQKTPDLRNFMYQVRDMTVGLRVSVTKVPQDRYDEFGRAIGRIFEHVLDLFTYI